MNMILNDITLTSGDSWSINLSASNYDPLTLELAITKAGEIQKRIAATWNGSSYTVTLNPSETSTIPAGTYQMAALASGAGQRQTLGTATLIVTPDPLGNTDSRSYSVRMLEAIEQVIAGNIDGVSQYAIGGRSITRMSLDELMRHRYTFKKEVAKENGISLGKVFRYTF